MIVRKKRKRTPLIRAEKPKKRGRPSKRTDLSLDIACNLACYGHTLAEISDIIGVSESNLCEWLKRYSHFQEAIKRGRKYADIRVENCLYHRALGYEYVEVKTESMQIGAEKIPGVKTTKTKKHIAGDVTAQIFWLKNRKPEEWRDKHVFEGGGQETHVTNIIQSFNTNGSGKLKENDRERIRESVSILKENLNKERSVSTN